MGVMTEPAGSDAALMAIALLVAAAQKRAARMASFMVVGRVWVKGCLRAFLRRRIERRWG